MKRFFSVAAIVMMAIAVFSVNAYAGDGLKSGFMAGFTSSSSNAKGMNADNISQYHVGLTVKFPVAFGFAIQPAVLYQTKGTKLSDANIDNFKLNAKVGYLEVPVQIQWGPDLLAFRPYIFAEPFVGYGLFAKAKDHRAGETVKTSSFEKAGLSRWEYGLGLGAGVEVWRFQVSAKYFWNFGSLYSSDGELNQVGQTIKSAFKDGRNFNGVTISLAYMF